MVNKCGWDFGNKDLQYVDNVNLSIVYEKVCISVFNFSVLFVVSVNMTRLL